ncbi:uncharacterized protein LOC130622887 [Hydractinia symbiolongicarpus]|uniref:uncharacterized protein LOC130622887 n=1 Tax=Hydractinia symbiolongicarpus TaxID=13093 RepID=UPI00254B30CE|nr:uncharacterized protein LOC130622887 [Hydractinia symbiolongicarpus]XP_057294328.1 uncharacterized protein LOC130622887 [Hydractinia symbiolongicarpus]XP_057294329.1 uncharacterized protein LOC130622887 [Hydractinia symbiolongicarpus]
MEQKTSYLCSRFRRLHFTKTKKILWLGIFALLLFGIIYQLEALVRINPKSLLGENIDTKEISCWKDLLLKKNTEPSTILCAFQPLTNKIFKRKRKTVVLGMGVHLGHDADQEFSCRKSGIEYISWEKRSKDAPAITKQFSIFPYDQTHLMKVQQAFWEILRNHSQLVKADIIICGFDAWHCLMFAPFNKKMIINPGYRFEGHLPTNGEQAKHLQSVLYNAVRYNPDVIMAGHIIYDILYEQHFLGSHKIIPLPATGYYVRERLEQELQQQTCQGVPLKSSGYHPNKMEVLIMPKRLSRGGHIIAKEIKNYSEKSKRKYKVELFEVALRGRYNYCQIGTYQAGIVLGYSVMSYFTSEVATLGIPLFVPTPRLYAEWERKYHLIEERKNNLSQTRLDDMKENPRSINLGYNPNDDFNEKDILEWVKYSDYYYYDGVQQFDSYEELFEKLQNSDLKAMSDAMLKGRKENRDRNVNNLKAIERYFFNGEQEQKNPYMPKTFSEGMQIWQDKLKPPKFIISNTQTLAEKNMVIINYEEYIKVFTSKPLCALEVKYSIIFYSVTLKASYTHGSCTFLRLQDLQSDSIVAGIITKFPLWTSDRLVQDLISLVYAIQNKATAITKIFYNDLERCKITKYSRLLPSIAGWSEITFPTANFWYAWIPYTDSKVVKLWYRLASKFVEDKPTEVNCFQPLFPTRDFSTEDIYALDDYLQFWKTDEKESFFNLLDQLNFELAVRGYTTKYYAELHRTWLETISGYVKSANALLIKMQH